LAKRNMAQADALGLQGYAYLIGSFMHSHASSMPASSRPLSATRAHPSE
jgi:hypothetical protein